MGVAMDNRQLGLIVLDPWELRGATNLNLREPIEDLRLKVFAFVAQEKPRVIVIEEKQTRGGSKAAKILSEIIRQKNLDAIKVKRQDSLKHLSASTPSIIWQRLKRLYGSFTKVLKTPAELYACANALFAIQTQDFHSRTYVKPTPRDKTKDTQRT